MIFPLSPWGKVALVLIALTLALIWSMLQWPTWWKKTFRKDGKSAALKK